MHSVVIPDSLLKLARRLVLPDLGLLVCLSPLMRAQPECLLLLEANSLVQTQQRRLVKLVKLNGQMLIPIPTILIIGVATMASKLQASKVLLMLRCKALSDYLQFRFS
jgi:hypothetical protein